MTTFERITQQPEVMGGKACIKGTRVTVGMIVGQIGAGKTQEAVLADYPSLTQEDLLEALRYAAWRAEERDAIVLTHDLDFGALLTIEPARTRVRFLPLRGS